MLNKRKKKYIGILLTFFMVISVGLGILNKVYAALTFQYKTSTNFDILADGGIKTTYSNNGYTTVLMVDGTTGNVVNGSGTVGNVTCTTTYTEVSNGNYIKVNFNLKNTGSTAVSAGLATHADIQIGSNDSAPITALEGGRGFSMTDGTNMFMFIGKDSYGVTDIDTYWFGNYSQRTSNMWNQIDSTGITGIDSGMAFSWQNKTIPANGEINLSVLFGVGELNAPPTLTVTNTLKDSYRVGEVVELKGKINDADTGDVVTIKYAVDGGTEYTSPGSYTPNGTARDYTTTFTIPDGITDGTHTIQIWACDDNGNMSSPVTKTFTVQLDTDPPTGAYTLSPDSWTNGNVVITVTATDDGSGVKNIKLPNSTVVNASSATYTVSANGDYTFVLTDNLDNSGNYTVSVSNIDKNNPTATTSVSQPTASSRAATITINATDDASGVKKITKPDGTEVTTTSTTYVVTTPGNYNFKVLDNAGNEATITVPVTITSDGVEVKYVDQVTRAEIATKDTMTGNVGDAYTANAKTVAGYTLVSASDTVTGNMGIDKTTITFEYRKLSNVTVKYLDRDTNTALATEIVTEYKEGDAYTTSSKTFVGFNADGDTSNTSGTVGNSNITVIYYYKLKKVNIEITKTLGATDSTSEQAQKGAIFKLTSTSFPTDVAKVSPTTEYYSVESTPDGKYVIQNVPYGSYTITEDTVPNSAYSNVFYLDGAANRVSSFNVNVDEDRTYTYSVKDVPKRMKIQITKEDTETGATVQGDAHLEGAKYTIYRDNACTNAIETVTITKQADNTYKATTGEYLTGTYYVKETTAPTGYNIDTTVYTVTQDNATQTDEVITKAVLSKDKVIKNDVEIYKYLEATDSSPKKFLSGVEFTATLNSDPTKTYSATTNASGYCKITDLPYGTYTINETVIPDSAYDGQFTVGTDTTRVKTISQNILVDKSVTTIYSYSNVTNVAKKMSIALTKEDAETGIVTQGDAHLEGAEYTIYRDSACTDAVETVTIAKKADNTYGATTKKYLTGTYYVKETKAPIGYNLDTTVYTVAQDPAAQTAELVTLPLNLKDNVIKNSIDITKYLGATESTAKQKLAGATFKATLVSNTTKTYTATTDANGHCVIENLPYGTYKVEEYTIPSVAYDGQFTIGTDTTRVKEFTEFIEQDSSQRGAYTYTDITDVPKRMNITVYKEDIEKGITTQGDATLAGAEYTIYRDAACTDAIETITTAKQANGKYSATSKWYLVGTYYVKETKAPTGYLIDETVYTVAQNPATQSTETKTLEITSKDEIKRNDIDITKYLGETESSAKQKLSGATFSAKLVSTTSPDKDKVYTATSDANGHLVISDLPYGTYRVWESGVPSKAYDGQFTIGTDTTRVKEFTQFIELDDTERGAYTYTDITDVPKRMQIVVTKEDKEKGKTTQGDAVLAGAEYTVYRDSACTNELEKLTITKQADGTYSATSKWYLVGTYYVKETKAPTGYNIDTTVYTVTQNPATQTTEEVTKNVLSKDQVKKNDIDITKYLGVTDSTAKQKLAGATFSAKLVSTTSPDSSNVYTATTDATGRCVIKDLPYGTYKVWESGVPSHAYDGQFTIGTDTTRVKEFTEFIEQDNTERGKYTYTDITDVPKTMQIVITKEDTEKGKITQGDAQLEGAEYKVYSNAECTNEVETLTITKQADGTYKATSGWYLTGTYYVKETKAPTGYLIDTTVYKVEQDPATQTTEQVTKQILSKDQVKKNDIDITKYLGATDSVAKQKLQGAEFSAQLVSTTSPDSSNVYKATTDANGHLVITNLPYGTYKVWESNVPDNAYDGVFTIGASVSRVKEFNQFIEQDKTERGAYTYTDLTDIPEKMNITIYKEDAETGTTTQGDAHLEGARYTIYRDVACTDEVETVTIEKQADGTYSATTGWYLVGTYYIKEDIKEVVSGAKYSYATGYLVDENVYTVSQNPATQTEEYTTHEITSKEAVVRNDIKIYKYIQATDSTEKKFLSGVEFTATLNNDTTKTYSATTDANGYCVLTGLPYGIYTLTETILPDNSYDGEFTVGDDVARVKTITHNILVDKLSTTIYSYLDITNVAKKMNITVYKEDKETGKITQGDAHLEESQYTIYRDSACTDAIETLVITKQADGSYSATSGWYMVGTYYVKETKAPVGYNIDPKVYKVEQDPATQTTEFKSFEVVSKDEVKRNSIDITKYLGATDSTEKQKLAGAEFSAQLVSTTSPDSSNVYKATTDLNGHCVIADIPYGTYKVWESGVPSNAYDAQFTIGASATRVKEFTEFVELDKTERGAYTYTDITDVPEKMNITIYKEDAETGIVPQGDGHLEGARYTLYRDAACTDAVETLTIEKQADGKYSATSKWYLVGTYYVKEDVKETVGNAKYSYAEGYLVDENVYTVEQNPADQTEEYTSHEITSKEAVIRNDIKVYKYVQATDSTEKQFLQGVEFTATLNKDTTKTYSATTDANGYCVLSNLPYGVYTLTETVIPDNAYDGQFTVGDNETRVKTITHNIVVDKKSTTIYSYGNITNVAKKMNITIYKEDVETGKITQGDAHLENAEYTLYRDAECTDAVETLTIEKQADGSYSATSGWYMVGTYYVKETKAPIGYLIDENVYTVEQNPAEQTTEHTSHEILSKNEVKRNDIDITKYLEATDSTPKQKLEGAEFSAQIVSNISPDKDKVYRATTDANGHLVISQLPYGTYRVWESNIPSVAYDGQYTIGIDTTRVKEFTEFIELDDTERGAYTYSDLTDVAKKMNITIYKEDAETGRRPQGDAHLEGARYTLYRDEACTDAIETVTIEKQADGKYSATSKWYLVGTYYIKEDVKEVVGGAKYSYATGYLVDEKVYKVEQNPEEQTTEYLEREITSREKVVRNSIEIIKDLGTTSNTNQTGLEECRFTAFLVSNNGFSVECDAQTDENGYCRITDLPYGTYMVKETTVSAKALQCADFEIFVEKDKADKTTPYVPRDGEFQTIILGEENGEEKEYGTDYEWLDENGHIVDIPKVMQIKIRKVDEYATTDHRYTQGDAVLEGAVYEVYRYDTQTGRYSEHVYDITIDHIDDEGYWCGETEDLLAGKYMVREKVKASVKEADGKIYNYSYAEGYLVDEMNHYFEVKPELQNVRVSYHKDTSVEKVIRGKIDAIKYNDISGTTEKLPATGAVLRLTLDSNPEIYYEAVVGNDGSIEWVEDKSREEYYPYTIPYGVYTISEIRSGDSHENIFMFNQRTEIKHSAQYQNYTLNDEVVRLKLKIEKVDAETDEIVLGNGTFKIWSVKNQDWYGERVYPSGEYKTEFTTNNWGEIQFSKHIEAGSYVIYETKAPNEYYLEDNLREGSNGYEFTISVESTGEVTVSHDGEREVVTCNTEIYEAAPVRIYRWTARIKDTPQKAVIKVTNLAEQLTRVETNETEYGVENIPIFEEVGLKDAEFEITAKEDIYTPDGTLRFREGQLVSQIKTDANGVASSVELYLGKYEVRQTKVPNGYKLNAEPVELNIEYTNELEKVQLVEVRFDSEAPNVNLDFRKQFKKFESTKFDFGTPKAVFGIYAAEDIKNSLGEVVIGKDTLIEVTETGKYNIVSNNYNLAEGKYYVKELDVTSPYFKSEEIYNFGVSYKDAMNGEVPVTIASDAGFALIINEAKLSNLKFMLYPENIYSKYGIKDLDDVEELEAIARNHGVSNTLFEIYLDKDCEEPLMTIDGEQVVVKTDSNGIVSIEEMPTGTYYLKGVKAPNGYRLPKEPIKVEVNGEENMVVVKSKVAFAKVAAAHKYDTYTTDQIEGIEFEITDEDENVICTTVTDSTGALELPVILFKNGATYYYREIAESNQYKIDEMAHDFEAHFDETTLEWKTAIIPIGNSRRTTDKVLIRKTDDKTGKPLQGCVFTIVLLDENGREYVNEKGEKVYLVRDVETNEKGEYLIENVPYGSYRFVEIKAPEGYEIYKDVTGLEFTVDINSPSTIIFEVTNGVIEQVETGDIAVVAIAALAVVSILGIIFVVLKNKKK